MFITFKEDDSQLKTCFNLPLFVHVFVPFLVLLGLKILPTVYRNFEDVMGFDDFEKANSKNSLFIQRNWTVFYLRTFLYAHLHLLLYYLM